MLRPGAHGSERGPPPPLPHSPVQVLGHELKATGAVLDANICGLHVPLSLCVRYLGMGLWVSTQLALHPEELVYGCLDSGATVVRSDSEMNGIMRQLGERLNLKPHPAGMSHEAAKTIYGPTDLQVSAGAAPGGPPLRLRCVLPWGVPTEPFQRRWYGGGDGMGLMGGQGCP